jgi:hypothetical protein
VRERIGPAALFRRERGCSPQAKLCLSNGQREMQFAWEREAKENGDFIEW